MHLFTLIMCPFQNSEVYQDFFLLLAVCNTVIVAKHPRVDTMNASGMVYNPTSPILVEKGFLFSKRKDAVVQPPTVNKDEDLTTPTSTSTVATNASSIFAAATTAPIPPDPILSSSVRPEPATTDPVVNLFSDVDEGHNNPTQPPVQNHVGVQRKKRLVDMMVPAALRPSGPLSPIASSPENSPSSSPQHQTNHQQQSTRPKHLQLPAIWSKLVSSTSLTSIGKGKGGAIAGVAPTPLELRPIYEAESPDELALVDAAYAYNCRLIRRSPNSVVVCMPVEGSIEFEVLHILPFDSIRKRMSIMLRHPETKEKILYCKGADSAIFPRLKDAETAAEQALIDGTQAQLDSYSKQGLRVLVMAKKIVLDEEYDEWSVDHSVAEVMEPATFLS